MTSQTLYVSDVDSSITDEKLREIFSKYGTVTHATIKKSVKGVNDFFYAFIEFDKPEEAAQALKEMDQQELAGKRLSIKFAKARETRPYSTSRPFYGDIKPRENKFDNYRHSPRGRSHSRERGMERYSYGMNERMYSRERREMRDNRDMRDLRDRRDERDSMRYSRDDMSREMNRDIPREMNREMNRDLSREMPREMNREINREMNRDITREMNREEQPKRRMYRDRFQTTIQTTQTAERKIEIQYSQQTISSTQIPSMSSLQQSQNDSYHSSNQPQNQMNQINNTQQTLSPSANQMNQSANQSINSYSNSYNNYHRREFDHNPRDMYQRDDRYNSRDDYGENRGYERSYERNSFNRIPNRNYDNDWKNDRGYSGERMKPYMRRDDMRDNHFSNRGGYNHQY